MATAKPSKPLPAPQSRRERLASFEVARKKEQRRRTLILLLICVVLAGGLLAYPVTLFVQDYQARNATLSDIGVSVAAAGCDAVQEHAATGNQQHMPEGTKIPYEQSPPDSGPHYPTPAPFTQHFYASVGERPAVSTLVHNLEHGYTVVWYRESLPAAQKSQLQAIAKTFASDEYSETDKFIAAPWADADGAFPEGKNVVLTRWYADPTEPSNQAKQKGVRQACASVSGPAIKDFMTKYPATNAPEPGGA